MCIAIAEGKKWLDWKCAKGKVMYVNLELDRASCLHRFKDVYQALGYEPQNLSNIDIWNLRGKSIPMDKLAPKLIRRAAKKNYIAIIIDPIYKVITGDENSADQMAKFCNQFDKVCNELGCAVIYCHHHSKGGQGTKKSMDRASGSGVFARDPDALLDLIELETNDDLILNKTNNVMCDVIVQYLNEKVDNWEDFISQDDMCSSAQMKAKAERLLTPAQWKELTEKLTVRVSQVEHMSAWRVEGTLREFNKFQPVNLWFDYPRHVVDKTGVLKDINPDDVNPKQTWKKNFNKNKKTPEERKKERIQSLDQAFESLATFNEDNTVDITSLADSMGVTEKTIRNRLKEHGGFWIDEGKVGKK